MSENCLRRDIGYVRHHHIPLHTKLELQAYSKMRFGIDISGLSAAEVQARRLPMRFLRPVLPSPRHLKSNIIVGDAQGMASNVPAYFLLDCPLPPDVIGID